ncbi:hypothetical protein FRB94_000106 [Tulasnella sp. JGI-2019a]|nr:hypothetical protein FRB94_000106 [Tulasnella sp. JGI-2019a]
MTTMKQELSVEVAALCGNLCFHSLSSSRPHAHTSAVTYNSPMPEQVAEVIQPLTIALPYILHTADKLARLHAVIVSVRRRIGGPPWILL